MACPQHKFETDAGDLPCHQQVLDRVKLCAATLAVTWNLACTAVYSHAMKHMEDELHFELGKLQFLHSC